MEKTSGNRFIDAMFGVALVLFIATACTIIGVTVCGCTSPPVLSLPPDAKQVVLVIPEVADESTALVFRFQKFGTAGWRPMGLFRSGNIGKNGLTFRKKEGDGKTPAGVFPLGAKWAYGEGIALAEHLGSKGVFPFKGDTVCVNDAESRYYNFVIGESGHPWDWWSSQRMWRDDDLYSRVVEVEYNSDPVVAGAGSCVFFHVWQGRGIPTSGSVALSSYQMDTLLWWLDGWKRPHVVVLTREEYVRQARRPGSGFPATGLLQAEVSRLGEEAVSGRK